MPLYEYECERGHRFERIVKFSDPPIEICPECGGVVHKLMSSPAIQFKGSGFYINDYARKGGEGKDSKETKSAKSSSEGGESKDSKDSKETKTEKAATTESSTATTSKSETSSTPSTKSD